MQTWTVAMVKMKCGIRFERHMHYKYQLAEMHHILLDDLEPAKKLANQEEITNSPVVAIATYASELNQKMID
jgi:hypothetical protein